MYKLSYDFKQYNDILSTYMELIVKNSKINFQNQIVNSEIKDSVNDSNSLAASIQNLEEYLHYNFEKSPQNFNNVINAIINNVRTISVLPTSNRGIYGETQENNKIIYINPELKSSKHLTAQERTKLYMAHELGHVINNEWMKKVIEYANSNLQNGNLTKDEAQLFYDGFSMLDEATTQNRAENFVYESSHKKRPNLAYYTNAKLYNNEPYKSNLDYYGELQEPATMFARTLRGIGKENDDLKAFDALSQRATSPDFFNNILEEYTKDRQISSLILESEYMGLIKRASYANFGYGDKYYLKNSKNYLDNLRKETGKMRDYREPFENIR